MIPVKSKTRHYLLSKGWVEYRAQAAGVTGLSRNNCYHWFATMASHDVQKALSVLSMAFWTTHKTTCDWCLYGTGVKTTGRRTYLSPSSTRRISIRLCFQRSIALLVINQLIRKSQIWPRQNLMNFSKICVALLIMAWRIWSWRLQLRPSQTTCLWPRISSWRSLTFHLDHIGPKWTSQLWGLFSP